MTAAGSGEASPQRARRFCARCSRTRRQRALPAAVRTLSRAEKRLRSVRGRFCVATFAVPGGKGRCPRRSGRFRGRKNASAACGGVFAWQRSRSRRQRALPTAVAALSRAKKRLRSMRGAFSQPVRPSWAGRTQPAAPALTSGGALAPLRPPPFPRPPQRAGPGASPPAARACTGRQRRRWPAGGRRTSGGCRNGFA